LDFTSLAKIPKTSINFLKQLCAKCESLVALFNNVEQIKATQEPLKGFIGFLKEFKSY
jgi:hypothetical protein